MKVVTAVGLLLAISFGITASADKSCQAVDLRRPDLNRPQSQVFINADGKIGDSGLCATFSSTLLISQQLGISINPVDQAFQNLLAMESPRNSRATARPFFRCKQEAVDKYLGKRSNNFIQVFADFTHQLDDRLKSANFEGMSESEKQKIVQWLDDICGERIQSPDIDFMHIDLKPKDWSGSAFIQPGYTMMSESEIADEIDRLLNNGQFVSYTHDQHAVTIVGRTGDCRYIIQDSIPESAWITFGGLLKIGDVYKDALSAQKDRTQISFENRFFQYWPRDILLKNVGRIEYAVTR